VIRLPSIRSKLLALFLVAAAIPLVGVSLISYFNSMEAVEEMVTNRTQRLAGSIDGDLDRKISRRLDDRIFWMNHPVQRFLAAALSGSVAESFAAQHELRAYLRDLFDRYQDYYNELILAGPDGSVLFKFHHAEGGQGTLAQAETSVIVATRIPGSELGAPGLGNLENQTTAGLPAPIPVPGPPVPGVSITSDDREAARRGADLGPGDHLAITDLPQADGSRVIRLVHPVYANDDPARRIGTLVVGLRPDYLFGDELSLVPFGGFGEVMVVDRTTGQVMFHSDSAKNSTWLSRSDPRLAAVLAEPGAELATHRVAGDHGSRVAVLRSLEAAPWTVIATGLPREFQKEARRAGFLNLMVASAAVILAGIVLLVSSGRISRSIKQVTAGARAIADGDLQQTIQVQTHDEIQVLGETFNRMSASLRENIALRERAARELEALNRTLEDRVRERTQRLQSLNEALNQANRELKELDRLKSQFLATVSHELKTPLTSIKAFAEILMDEAEERETPGDTGRFLGIINSESERLGRLIRNLLSLSQIESGRIVWNKSDFPVHAAVDDAVEALHPVIQDRGVRIERDFRTRPWVHADRDRIQEVVANLVDNAIKFSEREGSIRIHLDGAVDDGEPGEARITIRDSGAGIPEAFLGRIFERFSQADPSDTRRKGGTGLGLAICREIVEYHGGRIWAESPPGSGAVFHVTLPATVPASAEDGERA